MQNPNHLTVYLRKVDKKAIKLPLCLSPHLTPVRFYDLLIANKEFLKFVQSDLPFELLSSPTFSQQNYQKLDAIRTCIELYYGGSMIDKSDDESLLSLRNLTIVHLVVRKTPPKTPLSHRNSLEAQHKQQTAILKSAAKSQQHPQIQLNSSPSLSKQQEHPLPISLSIVIAKNTKVIDQSNKTFVLSQNLPIKQQISAQINRETLIKHTLTGLNLIGVLSEQLKPLILSQDQTFQVMNISKCVLKLVHLGKMTGIVLDAKYGGHRTKIVDKNQTKQSNWSDLNLFTNSEVIVLVSLIHLDIQKVKKILSSSHKSLFLELQHILTIRLYEEYKKWDKQWNYSHQQNHESLIQSTEKQKVKQQKQVKREQTQTQIPLSNVFEPLKELREFYDQQKALNPTDEWIKNNQNDTIDECEFRDRIYEQQEDKSDETSRQEIEIK